ncbi:carboxylesterase/lipase family protein [Nonomuraea sp. NPDC050547]|uniref:carboxylesterase/lipase family protein n=1 Tax=Nonomuraea sp. NPDC050547 TaxID=3364368 RepID=UPI0037B4ACC0
MTTISTGKLTGRTTDDVTSFLGIPYAEAPFGPNRFAAPVPAGPWEGTFEAVRFGPQPPQPPLLPGVAPWSSAEGLDCLSVNVWTPDPGGAGLPVMVWIYGGAYLIGTAGLPEYDGTRLAREGVVVVTFNHRVGMEGYGLIEGAPANRALLDQVQALRWVRENIAAFGGDPGNVTVFGESAGAGAAACLMAMPSAAGLFRRVIAQSVPATFYAPELAARMTAGIMARAGGSPYERSPEELLAAVHAFSSHDLRGNIAEWGASGIAEMPFAPVVDGEVLPETPWEALADGAACDVDLLVGFTRDEYALFMAMGEGGDTAQALKTLAPPQAGVVYRTAYPEAELQLRLMSDWLFRMPSTLLADAHTGPTYAYELTWAPTALGACHGLDVPLTFGTLDSELARLLTGGSSEAEGLSAQFRSAWTRFAATGSPGWPEYEPVNAMTHLFDVTPSDVGDPESATRALWSEAGFHAMT